MLLKYTPLRDFTSQHSLTQLFSPFHLWHIFGLLQFFKYLFSPYLFFFLITLKRPTITETVYLKQTNKITVSVVKIIMFCSILFVVDNPFLYSTCDDNPSIQI